MNSNLVRIHGNTYPVREELKTIGARWDTELRVWMISPHLLDQADEIVAIGEPMESCDDRFYSGPRCYCINCGEPYEANKQCWQSGGYCEQK